MRKLFLFFLLILLDQRAAVSVTYTFSANTLIVAAQINQNFTDLVNGVNNITTDQLASGSVTNDKMANNAIDEENIVDGAVSASKIDYKTDGLIVNDSGLAWGRAGDMLISANTATPDGFTDVSTTFENRYIKISSLETPLATGGSETHEHTVQGHSLTIAEMPQHNHGQTFVSSPKTNGDGSGGPFGSFQTMTNQGSGAAHTHGLTFANNTPLYVAIRMYQKN